MARAKDRKRSGKGVEDAAKAEKPDPSREIDAEIVRDLEPGEQARDVVAGNDPSGMIACGRGR